MNITDWLHVQAIDQKKKRQDELKRKNDLIKKQMRPALTAKARRA